MRELLGFVVLAGLVGLIRPSLVRLPSRRVAGALVVIATILSVLADPSLREAATQPPPEPTQQAAQETMPAGGRQEEREKDTGKVLDQFLEDFRLNFGQTSWAGHVKKVELASVGNPAALTIYTDLYPKASNEQPARQICAGAIQILQGVTQATRATVMVRGQGDSRLLQCDGEFTQEGKFTRPLGWQVFSGLRK